MLTTIEILDQLKAKLGSDYRTAKELDLPPQRVSGLRRTGGVLTDQQALKAAKILGLKDEFIILSLAAERSKESPAYSILKRLADKLEPKKAVAAAYLMLVFTLLQSIPLDSLIA